STGRSGPSPGWFGTARWSPSGSSVPSTSASATAGPSPACHHRSLSEGRMRNAPADLAAMSRYEHPRLVRALDLWSGDLDLAEAVAEDAIVRLWRRWPVDAAVTWLYETALDLARDRPARPDFPPEQAEARA